MFDIIARHTFQIICCYVIATIAASLGSILVLFPFVFQLAVFALPFAFILSGSLLLFVIPWAYPIILGIRKYIPERQKLVPISMFTGVIVGLPIVSIGLKASKGYYSPTSIFSAITDPGLIPMIIPAAAAAGSLAWFLSREGAY